jgi:hypothetical protein
MKYEYGASAASAEQLQNSLLSNIIFSENYFALITNGQCPENFRGENFS